MARRASPGRRSLFGVAVLVCLACAASAGAEILRFGVDRITLGWTPPEGEIHSYAVLVSLNRQRYALAASVTEPRVTLQVEPYDLLEVRVVAVGRRHPGGPIVTSVASPPSEPIRILPAPSFDGEGTAFLHCASCSAVLVRPLSTAFDPIEAPGLPAPWRLAAVGPIAAPGELDTLWQDPATGELRVLAPGAPVSTPVAVSEEDLSEFEALGLAEVDGDAQREIILRRSDGALLELWKVEDDLLVPVGEIPAPFDAPFAGAADIDGDGTTEIWWQIDAGRLIACKIDPTGRVDLVANIDTQVAGDVVALADFDGDEIPDALWRGDDGLLTITYLTAAQGSTPPGLRASQPLFHIADFVEVGGAADVDGRPGAEIVLQRRDDYRVQAIAPLREDLLPLVTLFDVAAPFELLQAQ